ncbi:MAG TPA: MFS transporter [Solirubrobacterales bacterium]|nr:MFS transporter [Solirubrobacterales bacterium]
MSRAIGKLRMVLGALAIDFRNPNRARLAFGKILTFFAGWSFALALGVYGFEAHGIVGAGLVALIRFLPGAVAAPVAGVLIDRHERRTVLVLSSLAMAVVLAGAATAAALGAPTVVVFVFPALYAVVASAYAPAESSLSPLLAKTPQQLSAGNVNHAAMENAGSLLGAVVTGLLLTATSPSFIFGVSAVAAVVVLGLLLGIGHDHRPAYIDPESELAGAVHEIVDGVHALAAHPALRLAWTTMAALLFFEGFAEVAVVSLALQVLGLSDGSVGFLTAAWGVGALVGGACLALLLDRGRLVVAIAGGSLLIGLAVMLPGFVPQTPSAYVGWFGIGIGFVFVEVAAKTLMQRLGDDETMGRLLSFLEAGRLGAMALGSIAAIALVELLHTRGALIMAGVLMPAFVLLCWTRLRAFEVGAPVAEGPYRLLRGNSIFEPLPVATVERLSHDLSPVGFAAGEDVIVQGERGDRFFVIESGQVEVFENGKFRRNEGPGESFGEIALLHSVPRTATVRTTEPTRLLALERDQFLTAVTGHRRSHQLAGSVVDDRWASREDGGPGDE